MNNAREGLQSNEWRFYNEQLEIQLIWFIETPADCVAMWDTPFGTRPHRDCAGGCNCDEEG
jgi:hypothetical protein